ncbi:MAG: MBL fold metallo-hydrolase [Candidatus Brocadiaceae baterium WH-1]|uniref:MBL fold metallo-hydrolase n=1 Tax=Candidatus Loosdrechtia sp. TaxID=3101272 RepID=UPI003A784405|nr:MAG: MBL fold metallo-hydrolase [Candidatus Jettenia sp. AMX2]
MDGELHNMIFETLTVGPLAVNCYIIGSKKDNTAVVIDAGGHPEEIMNILKKHNLVLQFLLNTHAHFDHVGGVRYLQDQTKAKFLLHQCDIPLLNHLNDQTNAFGMPSVPVPKVEKVLLDNEELSVGNEILRVIHTPGHSPGSVCFLMGDALFSGDTLFAGSIGRTDFQGGSYAKIIDSIKTRLFTLGDHVIVYPGHGERTTIGEERQHNPFF